MILPRPGSLHRKEADRLRDSACGGDGTRHEEDVTQDTYSREEVTVT